MHNNQDQQCISEQKKTFSELLKDLYKVYKSDKEGWRTNQISFLRMFIFLPIEISTVIKTLRKTNEEYKSKLQSLQKDRDLLRSRSKKESDRNQKSSMDIKSLKERIEKLSNQLAWFYYLTNFLK